MFDSLKVQAVINLIDGKTSDGSQAAPVPSIFGMNFQAVSVGQKLKTSKTIGGYMDASGTPTPSLLDGIKFVDAAIGTMVAELKSPNVMSTTLIIVSAKHGQSPINPKALVRVPADNKTMRAPSEVLDSMVAGSIEDDAALIWLTSPSLAPAATQMLQDNLAQIGGGEIFEMR